MLLSSKLTSYLIFFLPCANGRMLTTAVAPRRFPPPDFARLGIAGEAGHQHVAPTVQRKSALACPAFLLQPALFTALPLARPPSLKGTGPFVLDPVYLSQGEILFSFTLPLL